MESNQLPREDESVGPDEEISYWRRLLVRFSSLIENLRRPEIDDYIQLLVESKSRDVPVQ